MERMSKNCFLGKILPLVPGHLIAPKSDGFST